MRVLWGLALCLVVIAWFQPSMSSMVMRPPVMTVASIDSIDPVPNVELIKWSVTQGGVTVVALVLVGVLFFQLKGTKDDKTILIDIVKNNTAAFTTNAETNSRLARALEAKGVL